MYQILQRTFKACLCGLRHGSHLIADVSEVPVRRSRSRGGQDSASQPSALITVIYLFIEAP